MSANFTKENISENPLTWNQIIQKLGHPVWVQPNDYDYTGRWVILDHVTIWSYGSKTVYFTDSLNIDFDEALFYSYKPKGKDIANDKDL